MRSLLSAVALIFVLGACSQGPLRVRTDPDDDRELRSIAAKNKLLGFSDLSPDVCDGMRTAGDGKFQLVTLKKGCNHSGNKVVRLRLICGRTGFVKTAGSQMVHWKGFDTEGKTLSDVDGYFQVIVPKVPIELFFKIRKKRFKKRYDGNSRDFHLELPVKWCKRGRLY
jgi:hypothetical protein